MNIKLSFIIPVYNVKEYLRQCLDSIVNQTYKNYELFVVADNCTDNTARVCENLGAHVYERFNEAQKGKGYALCWGIDRLQKDYDGEFDALCVFDADNLAAPDFLEEMNRALCSDADVAIGYRDTKNIHDSWVSEVYSIYWLMLQRFYHGARHNIGLSSMVGGTGFAFKLSALGEEGWKTYSITEDVEFSIQQILKGHK
ncbi:MAG: glycosyltransferase family 2 protein, partial [Christensenella sp.]